MPAHERSHRRDCLETWPWLLKALTPGGSLIPPDKLVLAACLRYGRGLEHDLSLANARTGCDDVCQGLGQLLVSGRTHLESQLSSVEIWDHTTSSRGELDTESPPSVTRDAPEPAAQGLQPAAIVHTLTDGHRVLIGCRPEGESISVCSPAGQVTVEILLTRKGPVVRVASARLEIETVDECRLRCGRLRIDSREGVDVECSRGIRIRSQEDLAIDGKRVLLNS